MKTALALTLAATTAVGEPYGYNCAVEVPPPPPDPFEGIDYDRPVYNHLQSLLITDDKAVDTWASGFVGDWACNEMVCIARYDPREDWTDMPEERTGVFLMTFERDDTGRPVRVFWTDSLTNSFQLLEGGITYPQNSYTDTNHTTEASGFYQVDVRLQ